MILVTGATGTIGSEVVRRLAEGGEAVRAMTRDPSRVGERAGIDVAYGDFDRPVTLTEAAAGASTMLLLTAPGPLLPAHDLAMLGVARSAGVAKVVKISAIGTAEPDNAKVGTWHRPGEEAVQTSGMAWTILRPASFASNTLRWAGPIRAGDPIQNMTGTGAQGVIDPRDVAAVAVQALTSSKHEGQAYTLTGPELLSVPDQAAQLGHVLGLTIGSIDISLDVARDQMLASGMDRSFMEVAINGAEFVQHGGGAVLTPDVQSVLGRPPGNFQTWARDHRTAFLGPAAR
jgi:uncharacterized protein YbjT (DUF2867 family)